MLRSDGKGEVPYCLGVNSVYCNFENVVFTRVLGSSVRIMLVSNGIGVSVDGNGGFVCGMAERNDTRNILYFEFVAFEVRVEDNFLRFCGVVGKKGVCGCPVCKYYVQF